VESGERSGAKRCVMMGSGLSIGVGCCYINGYLVLGDCGADLVVGHRLDGVVGNCGGERLGDQKKLTWTVDI